MMTSKEYEAMAPDHQYNDPDPPPGYVPSQDFQPYIYNHQPGMTQPGAPVMVVMAPQLQNPPPDHLLFNIIMTLFCCWPIGIFAILKSMAARSAIKRADAVEALELSQQAKRLGFWTLGVGVTFMLISIIAIITMYAVVLGTI